MKLSKRLKRIEQIVAPDYNHIWDCCCDHGFLGASLLSRQVANNIHFVDIVPELMTELENKLQQFYANSPSTWETHCLDVVDLPLNQYEGKHLVIIAGVGGDLMTRFLNDIHQNHTNSNVDFLLCPVNRQFTVRQKLIDLNFSLKHEILVEDKRRFYEVILVSSVSDKNKSINPVGNDIWQSVTMKQADVAEKYLNKTLSYYRSIQQGKTGNVDHIISAYQAIVI